MKIRYTDPAKSDLAAIIAYLEARSTAGMRNVVSSIRHAIRGAGQFPRRGRLQEDGSRKLVNQSYGYIIYYDIDETGETIDVLTIQHPARQRTTEDR